MSELENVKRQIDRGFDRLEDRHRDLEEKQKRMEDWLSEVDAKENTARHGRTGPGDNLLHGIPAEYRKHIELAAQMGYKDAIKTAALGCWC